jgi:hypothetical protein
LLQYSGRQGVHCEVESEGFEEKYRAVIEGSHPVDELVGQRWGKVEPALWRRRRSHSPIAPRCLQTARYGRSMRDPGRTHMFHCGAVVSDPISKREMGSNDI